MVPVTEVDLKMELALSRRYLTQELCHTCKSNIVCRIKPYETKLLHMSYFLTPENVEHEDKHTLQGNVQM